MSPLQCQICKHYGIDKIDISKTKEETVFVCRAFPEGIPLDIIKGKKSHNKHIKGDNGFKFEL